MKNSTCTVELAYNGRYAEDKLEQKIASAAPRKIVVKQLAISYKFYW
jgi:hypothetical protein